LQEKDGGETRWVSGYIVEWGGGRETCAEWVSKNPSSAAEKWFTFPYQLTEKENRVQRLHFIEKRKGERRGGGRWTSGSDRNLGLPPNGFRMELESPEELGGGQT